MSKSVSDFPITKLEERDLILSSKKEKREKKRRGEVKGEENKEGKGEEGKENEFLDVSVKEPTEEICKMGE